MTTLRLELAYDGAGFAGWAAQPGLRTVQGELERALAQVVGAPVGLTVAGRTDTGVHAWSQVAGCAVADPPRTLRRALNGLTGDDVAVRRLDEAADGFDARRDARSRTYCYRVHAAEVPSPFERGRALHWPHRVDLAALERCAERVCGRHDFTAFTPTETEHVRFEREVLHCGWRRAEPPPGADGEMLELWIEADAFMRNMVRILVGTMLEVGGGRRDPDDFAALLEGAPRERAGETVRPHGLYLASVRY